MGCCAPAPAGSEAGAAVGARQDEPCAPSSNHSGHTARWTDTWGEQHTDYLGCYWLFYDLWKTCSEQAKLSPKTSFDALLIKHWPLNQFKVLTSMNDMPANDQIGLQLAIPGCHSFCCGVNVTFYQLWIESTRLEHSVEITKPAPSTLLIHRTSKATTKIE